jgi:hypothetical protein
MMVGVLSDSQQARADEALQPAGGSRKDPRASGEATCMRGKSDQVRELVRRSASDLTYSCGMGPVPDRFAYSSIPAE